MRKTPIIIGAFLAAVCVLLSPTTHAAAFVDAVPLSAWEVRPGDILRIDTKNNIGYLVHDDGTLTSFLVASGQLRVVRYIGRIYYAATPLQHWTVRGREIKGDRTTFGKDGIFLRLFDGENRTPYGIHSHRSITAMLADDDRYKSMGCILVSDEILALIEETMKHNGNFLAVETYYGDEVMVSMED